MDTAESKWRWALESSAMIQIFRLRPSADALWLVGESPFVLDLVTLNGTTDLTEWKAHRASIARRPGSRRSLSKLTSVDIPWVGQTTIALQSLENPLATALAPSGVFLPVDTPATQFWLFDCTTVVDGGLLPGTTAYWSEDGGHIIDLFQPIFSENVASSRPVFRIRELKYEIFVDQSIPQIVQASGLRGLEFHEVWRG